MHATKAAEGLIFTLSAEAPIPVAPSSSTVKPLIQVRKPTSGAEVLRKARELSRPYGEALPATWDDISREQRRLETLMKLSLKQKILRTKPGWWKPSLSCSVIDDARRFDHQHDKHVHKAVSALRGAQATPADVPVTKEFATALLAVQRERLVGQRQGLGGDFGTKAIKKDDGGRKRWRRAVVAVTAEKPKAEESNIWQPRAKQSDSKSMFDSQECMERAFNCDWERALHFGVGEYVRKNHDDDDRGEVEKVRQCLLSNVWLVYSAFDYLASLGSGGINAINSNAFLGFIKEAKLVDPASTNCKAAHLDQLFVLINSLEPPSERQSRRASPMLEGVGAKRPATPIASAPTSAAAGPPAAAPAAAPPPLVPMQWSKARTVTKVIGLHSSVRTLERHEWLQALVRIAIMRYVLKGTRSMPRIVGVSEAVQVLLTKDMVPNLPPELTQTSNDYRRAYCYTDEVEHVLRAEKPSLLAMFSAFTSEERKDPGKWPWGQRMCMDDWLDFVSAMQLTDQDLSERAVVLAFVWARMRVIDEYDAASIKKLASLSFEDWLECLCRLALQKAWPDESTMKAAGHDDALEYLVWARANNANALTVLIQQRAVPWHQPPPIPPCDCVRHLVKGLIRRCEKGAEVEPNGKVTLQEARKFRKTILGIKR